MSDWSTAFSEVRDATHPDLAPQIDFGDGEIPDPDRLFDRTLLSCVLGVTWSAGATLSYGQVVFPSARNGHRYKVVKGGVTGSTEPSWGTSDYATVTDGSVVYQEEGADFAGIYDTRRAKYLVLDAKVQMAANENQYLNDSRGQASSYLYLNLVRERDKYRPIGVA